ncbi:hypothetical protein [Cupriavidus basilensis]
MKCQYASNLRFSHDGEPGDGATNQQRKKVHWTDPVSVQVLRQDAASLRAVAQAHMAKAGTCATSNHPADLLQQAAILDTAADVLALSNWT